MIFRRLAIAYVIGVYVHLVVVGFVAGYNRHFLTSPGEVAFWIAAWPVSTPLLAAAAFGQAVGGGHRAARMRGDG
jgi:hypothetical protein